MLHTKIEASDPGLIDEAARRCGELAIGCATTGGEVQAVIGSVRAQLRTLTELQTIMTSLEGDQRQVADATDEARLLAHSAKTRLLEGNETVDTAAATFAKLTDLVAGLGTRITSFASALEQVRRTTDLIDRIARTTNMLALNAAIEAERAGEGGAAFAVVATEVKNLARSTRTATDEVARTMTSLTQEAETFMDEVREGMAHGEAARVGLETITSTLDAVTGIVEQVDRQSEDIAHSAGTIHASVCRVGDELDNFAAAALDDDVRLVLATEKMSTLERDANAMFDTIVRSGFAHEDGEMVAIAVAQRDEFLSAAQQALATGKLARAALFDRDYRSIPGSNPERFDTRLNAFADEEWRPILDRVIALHPNIVSTACTDVNGYLPTHTSKYSEAPTGDPLHDAAFCRHRRILADDSDKIAKASDKPFHVSVFRRERKGGGHDVVRNVYVPLIIDGERWGDFEIAYRLS